MGEENQGELANPGKVAFKMDMVGWWMILYLGIIELI